MRNLICVMVMTMALACVAHCAAPKAGDVVFRAGFEKSSERDAWPQADFVSWDKGFKSATSMRVTVAPDQLAGGHMISIPLDLSRYGKCKLLFECMAKADKVTKPPHPYLGVKFMVHYGSKSQGPAWVNENDVHGSFDWRRVRFTARIPEDVTGGQIGLGLQDSSGQVWFDDINITVFSLLTEPPVRPKPPVNPPPAFKGHNLPRLRGAMSPNYFRDEDMRVLGTEWKANVIRWQLTRNWGAPGTDRDLAEYGRWLNGRLDELDKALVACRRYGMKVVVDIHSPPGGRYANNDMAIFNERKYQEYFVEMWRKIARRYKGNTTIWGYDLINEPQQEEPSPRGVADYLGTQVLAAKAIRKIDPKVPIFIEAAAGDSAWGFRELEPVKIPNVIYQVHMYSPGEYTHQGVGRPWVSATYPGVIAGELWNKDRIRKELQPAREFELAYNAHIYVGEFSAIRWAPGAADYLRDCIDIFEEYGWDWTYHAFREWDGWSVEHGSDKNDAQPTKEPTDRKKVLLEWFEKNVKPTF